MWCSASVMMPKHWAWCDGPSMTGTPRIASHIWVGALLKRCRGIGVMATVLAKGDAQAGSISLACRKRDGRSLWLTATMDSQGDRAWLGGRDDYEDTEISQRLERLRRTDPDAWVVELESDDPASLLSEAILPA
jgi:hypothetical protein